MRSSATTAGMPGAFLSEGCTGYVAPLWNVDDTVAREFATEFYAAALEKDTVAESLRRSGRALAPTGAANGDAAGLRLLRPPGTDVREVVTASAAHIGGTHGTAGRKRATGRPGARGRHHSAGAAGECQALQEGPLGGRSGEPERTTEAWDDALARAGLRQAVAVEIEATAAPRGWWRGWPGERDPDSGGGAGAGTRRA